MSETENLTGPVTVMLTPTAKKQLTEASRQRGIKMSTLVRIIITEWLTTNTAEK